MRSSLGLIAAAVTLAATTAQAADMPAAPPICVTRDQAHMWPGVPLCVEEFSAWYLRGDIGMTNQRIKRLDNLLLTDAFADSVQHVNLEFDSSMLFGFGFGYRFNNWLRFDVTGEYRGRSDLTGLDIVTTGGVSQSDDYRAKKSEWLFLANAYLDLGTWWCITPFVGAGIGGSRVTISSFTDLNINAPGGSVSFGATDSKWNFAWALHAGLAYQASKNLAIELAYRYTHLGDGIAGDQVTFTGTNAFDNPTTFKGITSHDLKLGVRWTCCDVEPPPPVYAPPPVMRKG